MRYVEIESPEAFDDVAASATSMRGWRIQSVDLRGRTEVLQGLDPAGALLLGCEVQADAERHLREGGALLFPAIEDVPFDPYRGELYSPAELYTGLRSGYEATLDARTYAWNRTTPQHDVGRALPTALHDLSIDDALDDALGDWRVAERGMVGVLGGHSLDRGDPAYVEAARIGRALTRAGFVVATGGGPGAMEGANLGAQLAECDDSTLERAVQDLAAVPTYEPSVMAWATSALEVLETIPDRGPTLGVPTWFYGHEPPNLFATHVAKYFRNSLREAVLLHRCNAGLVFLPGVAGTVQEIFQAACESYYATEQAVVPMILVDQTYWTERLPAWPLLQRLAADRPMAATIACVADAAEAVEVLVGRRREAR